MGLKVLSSVCLLGFNLLVVHHFQPSVAGEFFLCITLVLVASQVARFGMDNVLVRHVPLLAEQGERAQLAALCGSALALTLLASSVLAALLYFAAPALSTALFSNPDMAPMISLMGLAVPFYSICLLNSYINQGMRRIFHYIVGLNLGQVTLASLLLIGAVKLAGLEASANLLAVCYVAGCALMMVYSLLSTRASVPLHPTAASRSVAIRLVVESAPLFAVAMTQLIMVWSSQFLLGVWAGPEDVAVYTIAQRVAMLTSFVLVAVNGVVAPRFSLLYHEGRLGELEALSKKSVRLMLCMATPLLLAMLAFPEWILGIFGSAYTAGALVLSILALGQFVNVITGSVGYLLQMSGHYREVRNNTLLAALLALVLNYLLIPNYGPLGGAIAAAAALSLVNLLGVWHVRKHLGFHTLQIT